MFLFQGLSYLNLHLLFTNSEGISGTSDYWLQQEGLRWQRAAQVLQRLHGVRSALPCLGAPM
jgi:hypothetical protein